MILARGSSPAMEPRRKSSNTPRIVKRGIDSDLVSCPVICTVLPTAPSFQSAKGFMYSMKLRLTSISCEEVAFSVKYCPSTIGISNTFR